MHLQEIARDTEAVLARVKRELDRLDATIARGRAELHAETAGFRSDLRTQFRWLLGVALAGFGSL